MNLGDILKNFQKPIERAHIEQVKRAPIWEALHKEFPQYARHCDVVSYHAGILKLSCTSGAVLSEMRGFFMIPIITELRSAGFPLSAIFFQIGNETNATPIVKRWKKNMSGTPPDTTLKTEDVPF